MSHCASLYITKDTIKLVKSIYGSTILLDVNLPNGQWLTLARKLIFFLCSSVENSKTFSLNISECDFGEADAVIIKI
jgi:hypothetical protein